MERSAVEGPLVSVSRVKVLQVLNKTGKATGPSEISLELIAANGGVGIQMMAQIRHNARDGFGMPAELALSIVVPIFKWKGDIRNCSCYELRSFLSMV